MTDLGAVNYFLGISVTRDSTYMFLSQKNYALELLDMAHMANYNLTQTPVDTESKLGSDGDPISDPTLYRSLAGGLQYLTFTCPDISYAVQKVCLHMHDPREPYLVALDMRSTSGYCVFLGDNLLSWLAKRQQTLSRSSAEAEYRGVANYQRTKHIEIDIHFVRDMVARGQVRVLLVASRYQYADISTKGLPSALFEEFHTSLSVRPYPAQTVGVY
nr:ribonuclease H-like domain-containing protein [Tanacetum cinerariifolium]